jgi:hypothetical protein
MDCCKPLDLSEAIPTAPKPDLILPIVECFPRKRNCISGDVCYKTVIDKREINTNLNLSQTHNFLVSNHNVQQRNKRFKDNLLNPASI